MMEVGRVCVKIAGREAGRYCVILKKIDENFVLVTGPKLLTGVKRRKCNVMHLEPTPYKIEIKEEASDREVIKAFEKANLIKKFELKKPSEAELKKVEEKKEEKKKPKKAKRTKAKKKS